MKGNIKEYLRSGFYKGVGITLGFFTTSLVAAAAAMNLFAPGEVISSARINQNFLIAAPEGAVVAFYLNNCPEGWAPADGTNGTPNLRGAFVRGRDDIGTGAAGRDEAGSRAIGHYQDDSFQGHYHQVTGVSSSVMQQNSWSGGGTALVGSDQVFVGNPIQGMHGVPRFGIETRPKNIALTYCMRKN
ncbi:phage tail protein [Leptospira levettii]|uniref:phage tail protein n=1 Tax=Leptospira levettii TaxID=2023178 RepID=UPI0010840180|nr:phage tail protein [Leptospira levettii]TGM36385.1 phage tail protein [Leptospira levettii]TGM76429.1 phage tail protein [Leptospira levettii]